jgi:hypothetical protein
VIEENQSALTIEEIQSSPEETLLSTDTASKKPTNMSLRKQDHQFVDEHLGDGRSRTGNVNPIEDEESPAQSQCTIQNAHGSLGDISIPLGRSTRTDERVNQTGQSNSEKDFQDQKSNDSRTSGTRRGSGLNKGSQAYRELQTAKKREKYRQREERQAEIKKESLLQIAIEDSKTVSVLIKQIVSYESGLPSWQYVKHSNSKLFELPPKAQIRHFHDWIERITGIPRNFQKFSQFDDSEAVTFRRCTDLDSPDFQKILGKTFRLLPPLKKNPKSQQWRARFLIRPATIPLHDHFSRPIRRCDISKYGLYFQKDKEAPKLRLRPCILGLCAPRVHRLEKPSIKELRLRALQSEFLACAQIIRKPDQPSEDWRSLIHPLTTPDPDPPKFEIQVDLLGHSKTWKISKEKAWDQITSRSGLDPRITIVLLNDKEWTGDRPVHPGDRIIFKPITAPVAPPSAAPEELFGKPESSSFQIHVKADEKARVCTLRVGKEFEDFAEYIQKTFGWTKYQVMFDGHP